MGSYMSNEKQGFHFSAETLVRGQVDSCAECCSGAGYIKITIPLNAPPINIEDSERYVVISAFNTDGGVYAVKVGEWVEAKLSLFGFMKKTNERKAGIKINEKGHDIDGSIGKVILKKGEVLLDLGKISFILHNKNDVDKTNIGKKLAVFGIRNGDYVVFEASLSIRILRKGKMEELYSKEKRYWARDTTGFLAIIPFSTSEAKYTFNSYKPKRRLDELLLVDDVSNIIRCLIKEPMDEKQISQRTSLSFKAVRNFVDELEGHGIVDTVSIPRTKVRVVSLRAKVVLIESRP